MNLPNDQECRDIVEELNDLPKGALTELDEGTVLALLRKGTFETKDRKSCLRMDRRYLR